MPYSQLLAIILALSLIIGAPDEVPPDLSPKVLAIIWGLKTLAWYGLCLIWTKLSKDKLRRLPDKILWFSIVPLFIDLYALNLKWFFPHLPIIEFSNTFTESIGLFLYFLYVTMGWSVIWRVSREIRELFPSQNKFVLEKSRLVLPALVPYLFAGIIGDIFRATNFPYSEFFFTGIFIISMIVILPPVTYRLWSCVPLPPSPLRQEIEGFLRKKGQKVKEILLWPAEGLGICTAAVLGIVPQFRYILLTPCLLNYLSVPEIRAVISHEMEHIKRRHMLWYIVLLIAYISILYRLIDPLWAFLLTKKGMLEIFLKAQDDSLMLGLFYVLPFALSFLLYFRFIVGFFMRNFEREADASIFETDNNPIHLINALEKVAYLAGGIRNQPNWHHYSIRERVDFLVAAYEDRKILLNFKRRLFKIKTAFIITSILLLALPSVLPKDVWETKAKENLSTIYIEQVLKREKNSPELYLELGNFFLEKQDYEKAERFLKKALQLSPNLPEALNNLAWLYATSNDPRFFRPKDALELAKRALKLKEAPYILDTLAEANFKNGNIKEAILLEKQAIEMKPEKKDYYERQLQRFMNALIKLK